MTSNTLTANAVLGMRAVYAMCSIKLPKGVVEAMHIGTCFRGQATPPAMAANAKPRGSYDGRRDRGHGGLGVKDLTIQYQGLLCKFAAKLQQALTTN